MAEQLNTGNQPFKEMSIINALPEDYEAPEEEEEEELGGEETGGLEEAGSDSLEQKGGEMSALDNISDAEDILGEFTITEEDRFDEPTFSTTAPDEDNKEEQTRYTQMDHLKEKVGEGLESVGESIVEFGDELAYVTFDQAKAVVQGVGKVGQNINNKTGLQYLYNLADTKLNEMGIGSEYSVAFNIKGSEHYDPSKPFVYMYKGRSALDKFLMDEEPETLSGQIIKPVTQFVVTMVALRNMVGYSAPATWGTRATEDVLVGNIAFSPDGKRVYEYFTDLLEELPVESDVGIKLANYLRNKDDDHILLKEVRVAADSIFMELGLTKLGGVVVLAAQTVKRLKNKASLGSTDKVLEAVAKDGQDQVLEYINQTKQIEASAQVELKKLLEEAEKITKTETKRGKSRAKGELTPSEELLNNALAFEDSQIMQSLIALAEGKIKNGSRILNLDGVEEVGLENVVDLLADIHRQQGGFGKGTSRTGIIKKKHLGGDHFTKGKDPKNPDVDTRGYEIEAELKDNENIEGIMSTLNSKTYDRTKISMSNTYNEVKDLSSKMFAYRVLLRDFALDLKTKLNNTDFNSETGKTILARQFEKLDDLFLLYGNIRGEAARTVTAERLKVLPRWLDPYGNLIELTGDAKKARDAFLNEQLTRDGMTPEFLDFLKHEVFGKTNDPLEALKWAVKGTKSVIDGTYNVFVEAFRSNLLSNLNVFQTAVVSGTIETFYAPLRDMLGSLGDAGLRTIRGKDADWSMLIRSKHRMVGLYKGYWTATKNALRALKNEQNILDPFRSVVDRDKIAGSTVDGFAIQASKETMENNATAWLGHLWNTAGKGVRLPIRVLGSIDEFLKQINYNSWVYAKMMEDMPPAVKKASEQSKKDWVKGQHAKYFDKDGKALNEEGLDFARRQIFQEDLVTSSVDRKLQSFVKSVYAEPFVPIIRTPSNVVKRMMSRTFAPFQLLRSEIRQKWNASPETRAKILGDTVIAGGILASTWDLIGSGRVTGAGPRDPHRKRLWEAAGFKPYSIRVGDEWYPYDRYAPFSAPLMMVANVYENSWEFNNRKDDVGLAMLMGVVQTIGDLHFLGNFFDFMDGMDQIYRDGEVPTSLIDKGILQQAVIPKYVTQTAHGIGYLKGQENNRGFHGIKNANTIMEKITKDVAALRGTD